MAFIPLSGTALDALIQASVPFWDENADGGSFGPVDNLNVALTPQGLTYSPNPWDTIFIAGTQLPGICRVKGQPTLAFDKKKSGGVDGATITVNGYLPGPVEIEITMWTKPQWQAFLTAAIKIWRKPLKKTQASQLALDVVHPAFQTWGIRSVIIVGVSLPEEGKIDGTRVVKFKANEYVPQVAKSRTLTARSSTNAPADARLLDPTLKPQNATPAKPSSTAAVGPSGDVSSPFPKPAS